MKFVLGTFVFILALGLSVQTLAAGGATNGHSLTEKMNALYPEKQKIPELVTRPAPVKLVSPKFMTAINGNSATLEWTAGNGANSYHVQVATDPNFKWLVTNQHLVQGNSFEVKDLQPATTYYWRVASTKSDNDSMYTKSLFESSMFSTQVK